LLTISIDKGKGHAADTPNDVQPVTLGKFSTDVHVIDISLTMCVDKGKGCAADPHDNVQPVALGKFSTVLIDD